MADHVALSAVDTKCGACHHSNTVHARYCDGCGHGLYENCAGCDQPVRLTAKYCTTCGNNLLVSLQTRLAEFDEKIERAVAFAKEQQYDEAIYLLRTLLSTKDYRFQNAIQTAVTAIDKIQQLKQRSEQRLIESKASASLALAQGEYQEVINQLQRLPAALLDAESKRMLEDSQAIVQETADAKQQLKQAIVASNWSEAALHAERLISLYPEHQPTQKILSDVAARLFEEAETCFAAHQYESAVDRLDAIPAAHRSPAYEQLRDRALDATWLVSQFNQEPYATPTLGRLAVRLAKDASSNPLGNELAAKIAGRLKTPLKDRTSAFPHWANESQSVLGGELKILGYPGGLGSDMPDAMRKNPARFVIATGLALQAIGHGRITGQLNEKKGFLDSVLRGKKSVAWGLDIGNWSLKAVCLSKEKDEIKITDACIHEFVTETLVVTPAEQAARMRDAVAKWLAERNLSQASVWCNFPARELLPRFIHLPPVDEKKAKGLLEAEIAAQFPVDVDQLALIRMLGETSDEYFGRPSALIAAKKQSVAQRLDLLASVGLKVNGIQAEPLAVANYAWHEHKAELESTPEGSELPGLAMVDAGATSTTLLVLSRAGLWFRSIEIGGSDMTGALARAAKVTATEAEALKRFPARLRSLAAHYQPVEAKQEMLRERLHQLLPHAQKAMPPMKILFTGLLGGTSFCHGWPRRMTTVK